MPSRRAVLVTRTAISPRLAIRIFRNMRGVFPRPFVILKRATPRIRLSYMPYLTRKAAASRPALVNAARVARLAAAGDPEWVPCP